MHASGCCQSHRRPRTQPTRPLGPGASPDGDDVTALVVAERRVRVCAVGGRHYAGRPALVPRGALGGVACGGSGARPRAHRPALPTAPAADTCARALNTPQTRARGAHRQSRAGSCWGTPGGCAAQTRSRGLPWQGTWRCLLRTPWPAPQPLPWLRRRPCRWPSPRRRRLASPRARGCGRRRQRRAGCWPHRTRRPGRLGSRPSGTPNPWGGDVGARRPGTVLAGVALGPRCISAGGCSVLSSIWAIHDTLSAMRAATADISPGQAGAPARARQGRQQRSPARAVGLQRRRRRGALRQGCAGHRCRRCCRAAASELLRRRGVCEQVCGSSASQCGRNTALMPAARALLVRPNACDRPRCTASLSPHLGLSVRQGLRAGDRRRHKL